MLKRYLAIFLYGFLICSKTEAQKSQFSVLGSPQSDFGTWVEQTPDGGYLETISLAVPGSQNIATGLVQLDCAGKFDWQKIYRLVGSSLISKKFVLNGEKTTLLGSMSSGLNNQQTHILEVDAMGEVLSAHALLSSQTEQPKDIISRANGNYLVLATGDFNVALAKIHLFLINGNFNVLQSLQFALPNRALEPEAMLFLDDGGVLIVGDASSSSLFRQGFVLRLSPGGIPMWVKTFALEFDVEFTDVVQDSLKQIHVSGYTFQSGTGFDGVLLQLNENGDVLNQKAYHFSEDDKFRAIETIDDELVLAGDIGNFQDREMAWTRLKTNGEYKDGWQLDYGFQFTNYIYSAAPTDNKSWLFTGEFANQSGSRNGGFIRTDSTTGGNCNALPVPFDEIDLDFTIEDVTVIRTELDRTVTVTPIVEEELPVFEEEIVCSMVPPVANVSYMPEPNCPEVCVQFTDSSYCSIDEWEWSFPGAQPENSTEMNPRVCYPGDGFYMATLIVTNEGGSDTLEIEVSLNTGCNLPVPNVFSPNGDGFNDLFVIPGFPPGGNMKIFNRWGNLVFEADDYDSTWDGANVTSGTYYYAIESKEGQMYSGYIVIVK